MRRVILAAMFIFCTFTPSLAVSREFPPGGTVIEIMECGVPVFLFIVTPDGVVFASPVYRESDGSMYLDSKEMGSAVMQTIPQAAVIKDAVERFHVDRHKGRVCVEAAIPHRPVS